MKAVNPVSALTSAQQAAGAQPVVAGFRQPSSQQGGTTPQGFSGQLANLASAQTKGFTATTTGQTQPRAQQSGRTEQAQAPASGQATDIQEQPASSGVDVVSDWAEQAPLLAEETVQPEPVSEPSEPVMPQVGATASALTELVKSYLSPGRSPAAPDSTVTASKGAAQPAAATNSQPISQEHQRLLATLSQKLSVSELRGLDTGRAEALKAALQSSGSSSGAQISAQSLLDSRPDLLTGSQRNPSVSEWAPIRLVTQQPQHWGRDLMAALGDRLSMQVNQNVKEARIRLDPPELGRIEMTVRLDGDRLNIQLNATHHQVRDLLTQHADRLRADLLAQNHQSVDVHVGHQSDQRESRPGYMDEEINGNGILAAENPDVITTEPFADSWLSTKA